jgi:hypothetical protein
MTTVYVDPQTVHNPSAGGKPPATWGDTVRDDIVSLAKPPMVKVSRSSTQSIANATLTAVQFDTEAWDTDAFHSTISNTSRITIPSGFSGRYLVMGQIIFDANATGRRAAYLLLNGATYLAAVNAVPTGAEVSLNLSAEASAVAGEYLELAVWQDSGAALNVQSGLNGFSARLVSWT